METTGERILKIRKILKLNQRDFGNKIGFKAPTISDIENNITTLQSYHAKLLHYVYLVSEEYVFTGQLPIFLHDLQNSLTDYQAPHCTASTICQEICDICESLLDPDRKKALNMIKLQFDIYDSGISKKKGNE